MSLFIVDVEADNSSPANVSMVSFGAVMLDENLNHTFYGKVAPINNMWNPEALAISDITREEHEEYFEPDLVMNNFTKWVKKVNKNGTNPVFISDNPAFDWQWINYYFDLTLVKNPFGFSARRIGDIYAGMEKDMKMASRWKKFRKTKHTHNPVDDARGNAEALQHFKSLGLKINY